MAAPHSAPTRNSGSGNKDILPLLQKCFLKLPKYLMAWGRDQPVLLKVKIKPIAFLPYEVRGGNTFLRDAKTSSERGGGKAGPAGRQEAARAWNMLRGHRSATPLVAETTCPPQRPGESAFKGRPRPFIPFLGYSDCFLKFSG